VRRWGGTSTKYLPSFNRTIKSDQNLFFSIQIRPRNLLSAIVLATMERVRKTFFDPLATSKAQVREILEGLPVGSAHPFSPEHILLCRTDNGIDEIDISSYPEDFFFNAVDLGEMGETLLRRMAGFQSHLSMSSLVLPRKLSIKEQTITISRRIRRIPNPASTSFNLQDPNSVRPNHDLGRL
jgi:hypothetical protein